MISETCDCGNAYIARILQPELPLYAWPEDGEDVESEDEIEISLTNEKPGRTSGIATA